MKSFFTGQHKLKPSHVYFSLTSVSELFDLLVFLKIVRFLLIIRFRSISITLKYTKAGSLWMFIYFFKLAKGVYTENVSIIDTGSSVKENLVT